MGFVVVQHIPASFLYMITYGLPAVLVAALLLAMIWAIGARRKQRRQASRDAGKA